VVCEEVETVAGLRACLVRATLDGQPFTYDLSPVGSTIDLDGDGTRDLVLGADWSVLTDGLDPVHFVRGLGNGQDFQAYTPIIVGGRGGGSFRARDSGRGVRRGPARRLRAAGRHRIHDGRPT
jgi:hypothetical protein